MIPFLPTSSLGTLILGACARSPGRTDGQPDEMKWIIMTIIYFTYFSKNYPTADKYEPLHYGQQHSELCIETPQSRHIPIVERYDNLSSRGVLVTAERDAS